MRVPVGVAWLGGARRSMARPQCPACETPQASISSGIWLGTTRWGVSAPGVPVGETAAVDRNALADGDLLAVPRADGRS